MKKSPDKIVVAFVLILVIPVLGYLNIGLIPAYIFLVGFFGGFILWLSSTSETAWESIKWPYFLTMALFAIHRVDEQVSGFFDEMEKLTGVPYPDTVTVEGVLITFFSLFWLLSPLFIIKKKWYGYLGAWTVFAAMGVSELAHFVFPLFTPGPYGYFPGMITVVPLAPVAWWGMWRLWHPKPTTPTTPSDV